MSPVKLILIGGGEHARVVAEVIRSQSDQFELLGFVDPAECSETTERLSLARLGDEGSLARYTGVTAVLGVGATGPGDRRMEIVRRLSPLVRGWASVTHRTASISPTAILGAGTVVMAGGAINSGAKLGEHCVVNTGAVIEHDAVLGDHVFVGPRAVIGGGTQVGDGAFIGLGASVRDHVTIGIKALVGMGAVVVRNVEAGTRVVGVPARCS